MQILKFIETFLLIFLCAAVLAQYFQIRKIKKAYSDPEFHPDNIKRRIAESSQLSTYLHLFLAASDKELDEAIRMAAHYDNCGVWRNYSTASKMRSALIQKQMADHYINRNSVESD